MPNGCCTGLCYRWRYTVSYADLRCISMWKQNRGLREGLIFLAVFIFLSVPSYFIVKQFTEQISPPTVVSDNGVGSSMLSSLMNMGWIPRFVGSLEISTTEVEIDYLGMTSGDGYAALASGTAVFAVTDYPLSQSDQTQKGVHIIPFVSSAVVVAFNLPEISALNVSADLLVGIYNGTVTSWTDPRIVALNPAAAKELPEEDIQVLRRVPGSGASYIFTKALSQFSSAWNTSYHYSSSPTWPPVTSPSPFETDEDMQAYIHDNPYTIGYISLSNFIALRKGIYLADFCFGAQTVEDGQSVYNPCELVLQPSLAAVEASTQYASYDNTTLEADVPYVEDCTKCWPMVGFSYIATRVDYSSSTITTFAKPVAANNSSIITRNSCPYQIYELDAMVTWMIMNNEAADVAQSLMSNPLASKLYHTLSIPKRLENITCDGTAIPKDPYHDKPIINGLTWAWISVIIIGATVLLCYVARMVYYWRKRASYVNIDDLEKDEISGNTSVGGMENIPSNSSSLVDNTVIDISPSLTTTQIGGDDLRLEEHIGTGSFAEVYKGALRGHPVAVKRILINQPDPEKVLTDFLKESSLMSTLRHKNIVQFLGATIKPPHLYIVLEYCAKGSLFDVLKNPAVRLSFKQKRNFAIQAAKGLQYLHKLNPPIIHRDLKTANLLVDENWNLKVTDFGLSRMIDKPMQTMTHCGTVEFCAPEVLQRKKYTQKADIYSYGILLWQIFTRRDLFPQMALMELMNRVCFQGLRPSTEYLSEFPELVAIITACWATDPEARPDWDTIIRQLRKLHDPEEDYFKTNQTSSSPLLNPASSSSSSFSSTPPSNHQHKPNTGNLTIANHSNCIDQ